MEKTNGQMLFVVLCYILKSGDGRTDIMCENNDHYWVGRVDHNELWKHTKYAITKYWKLSKFFLHSIEDHWGHIVVQSAQGGAVDFIGDHFLLSLLREVLEEWEFLSWTLSITLIWKVWRADLL